MLLLGCSSKDEVPSINADIIGKWKVKSLKIVLKANVNLFVDNKAYWISKESIKSGSFIMKD